MESRYALRELEGAIGYDCRRLEDGRPAVFRHTLLHKRAKRGFYERRDAMLVLHASYIAMSALAANPRLDLDVVRDILKDQRSALVNTALPYLKEKEPEEETKEQKTSRYDRYFDELDRILAMMPEKDTSNNVDEQNNAEQGVAHDDPI